MAQYLEGCEAFVNAVLEKEKDKEQDKMSPYYIGYDKPFITQQNYTYDFTFSSWFTKPKITIGSLLHLTTVGVWRLKQLKTKQYEQL